MSNWPNKTPLRELGFEKKRQIQNPRLSGAPLSISQLRKIGSPGPPPKRIVWDVLQSCFPSLTAWPLSAARRSQENTLQRTGTASCPTPTACNSARFWRPWRNDLATIGIFSRKSARTAPLCNFQSGGILALTLEMNSIGVFSRN